MRGSLQESANTVFLAYEQALSPWPALIDVFFHEMLPVYS